MRTNDHKRRHERTRTNTGAYKQVQAHTNKRGQVGMGMDEGRRVRMSTDEQGQAGMGTNKREWARMSGDEWGRARTNGDGHR